MGDPRFLPGDEVFVHAGPLTGATGRLLAVDERTRSARFAGARGGAPVRDGVRFEQLCLRSPPRRPVEEDALVAIRVSLAEAARDESRLFWLRKASAGLPDDEARAAAFDEAQREEQGRGAALDEALGRAAGALEREWQGLDRAARLARWEQDHARLAPGRPARTPAGVARAVLPPEELARLVTWSQTKSSEAGLEQSLAYTGQQIEREGRELSQRSREAAERLARVRSSPSVFQQNSPIFVAGAPLPDDAIERAARRALGRPVGPLSPSELASIERLDLVAHRARDLAPLAALTGLRSLSIRCAAPVDLGPLTSLTSLSSLRLWTPRASGLDALGRLPSLRRLGLWGAPAGAAAAVARLRGLSTLVLREGADDLGFVASLTGLRALDLSGGIFSDLGPLGALRSLEELWIEGCDADLGPLAGLPSLSLLRATGCRAPSLGPLLGCRSLRRVLLGPTTLDGVEALRARGVQVDASPAGDPRAALAGLPPGPEALVERLRPLDAATFSVENYRLQAALVVAALASGDDQAALAAVQQTVGSSIDPGLRLRGLALGDRAVLPFDPNPFGVPPSPDVDAEIARLWRPLDDRAPAFARALREDALGLCLVEGDAGPRLGYLHLWRSSKHELDEQNLVDPWPRRPRPGSLAGWVGLGSLAVLLGQPGEAPPQAEARARGLPGALPLPASLRELFSVHTGLESGLDRVEGPRGLTSLLWCREEKISLFEKRNQGRLPWRFVQCSDNGSGDGQALDLDELDGRGDPLTRGWDHETWQLGDDRLPFWDWFEEEAPQRLLKHPRDDSWLYWGAVMNP